MCFDLPKKIMRLVYLTWTASCLQAHFIALPLRYLSARFCRCCSNASASHEADVSLSIYDVKQTRRSATSERTIQQAIRLLDDPFITVCAEFFFRTGRRLSKILRSSAGALVASAPRMQRGGAYRDRTDDLLNANQALSQLS